MVTAVTEGGVVITIAQYGSLEYTRLRTEGYVIVGTKGAIEAYWRPDAVRVTHGSAEPRVVELDADLKAAGPWVRFHRQFRQCLEDGAPPPVTSREALGNVEWAMAAYLAHERRAWMDLPLGPEFYEFGGPRLYATVPVAGGGR